MLRSGRGGAAAPCARAALAARGGDVDEHGLLKAWTVLRTAQEGLGVKLLRSSTGGRNGGGATLTAEGERLLAAYEDYCAKLTAYGETLFAETFAFYDTLTEEKLE